MTLYKYLILMLLIIPYQTCVYASISSAQKKTLINWASGNFDLPNKYSIILDLDLGFDGDDTLALIYAANQKDSGGAFRPLLVTTNFWHPEDKARIARIILDNIGRRDVEVAAGEGIYKSQESEWFNRYPFWPKVFDYPCNEEERKNSKVKCIYNQGQSYKDIFGEREFYKYNPPFYEAKDAFAKFLLKGNDGKPMDDNSVIVIALSPTSNLVHILNNAKLKNKINRIVFMGGWFGSIDNPGRLGYNSIMDIESTKKLFESGLPIILVTSEECNKLNIPSKIWNQFFFKSSNPKYDFSDIGKAILASMWDWEKHSGSNKILDTTPMLAGLINIFIGLNPETMMKKNDITLPSVKIRIDSNAYSIAKNHNQVSDDKIDMHNSHIKLPNLFKVTRDKQGSIYVFEGVKAELQVPREEALRNTINNIPKIVKSKNIISEKVFNLLVRASQLETVVFIMLKDITDVMRKGSVK